MPTIEKTIALNTNRDALFATILEQYPTAIYQTSERSPLEPFIIVTHDNLTDNGLQTIIDNHNPASLTTEQQESAQATNAKTALQALMSGLHGLSAQDKGYALYGRIFAARNGANQATIDGITNKATAQAYITGLPEWTNMTAASKAFFAKELEANAGVCMVLLLVLT